ncbi:4'-phosphopantetheinyl transferase family protein [Pedobacter jejuensis]|uniref:4'-phosphopantetheinyl transferase superfamily protein n=1 Tax=Pedobacter jejuensis TaxID=1268550 RepID=A0A3N0BU00_9SPHI|nr:4'-phosphopantetheinyl transferase superfamily protein [Pedobacter jejuensis]RNL52567.1 4'-phosphopantetheinyl transferase superfamily protein [Pedobacter jejuensis]
MDNLINDKLLWEDYEERTLVNKHFINIFKISLDKYQAIKNNCKQILTADELTKASKFKQARDTKRYVIGKFYSKMILAKMINKKPADIHFQFNEYKKPYINNINFNISHSGDYVVLAISPYAVGIDIEAINPVLDYQELIHQCFKEEEIKRITDLDSFYLFWTRKEALLKATGEGLTDNLPTINCTEEKTERFGVFYELKSLKLNDGYFLSTASPDHQSIYKYWHLKH